MQDAGEVVAAYAPSKTSQLQVVVSPAGHPAHVPLRTRCPRWSGEQEQGKGRALIEVERTASAQTDLVNPPSTRKFCPVT